MHTDYREAAIKELRDQQVRFAPRAKKLEQVGRAEKLLGELEDSRDYSFDYLCFRITDFRPEAASRRNVRGENARHDLRLLVEDLSDAADIRPEETAEQVVTIEDLTREFDVSSKTISRWREQGLVSRRFLVDGRKRVGFLRSSVDKFVAKNRTRVKRSKRFRHMTDDERAEMVRRARVLAGSGLIFSEVVSRVSKEMGRSPETVRYTLKAFDNENPQIAIFPGHKGALSEEEKRTIYQNAKRGMGKRELARRYQRTPKSIERVMLEMRAAELLELPLDYIYNPDFDKRNRDSEFLAPMPQGEATGRRAKVPAGLPPYLASLYDVPLLTKEQEQHLFRKMNYLKHKAAKLRLKLDPKAPRRQLMDQVQELYDAAVGVKNKLVKSNLRLVVSIAKRHMASTDDFFALISDGNMSLIRAVDKFDYSRGNKFSTYATWAIVKNFARSIPDEFKYRDRFRNTVEELFLERQDERSNPFAEETADRQRRREVNRILGRLDEREQKIITARFGLRRDTEPRTLKEVGEEMGVTKERVRQIEARALDKLRAAASSEPIDVD